MPAARRPRLTGRSAIVIVVLAVLFVSYATSLRAWLEQRAHIGELEAQISNSKRAVAELREEKQRWRDPAYVEAQARSRFGWVRPGEIGLRVIGADGKPLDDATGLTDPASVHPDADEAWWSTTYESLVAAGSKPTVAEVAPSPPADRLGPSPQRRLGPRDTPRGR